MVKKKEPAKKSIVKSMANKFGMEIKAFEQTLRETVVPGNTSPAQFAAFLLVAKEYDLNPITREIFAFPSQGGIRPIVSIDGWMTMCNRHPQFNGMTSIDNLDKDGNLISITVKMFRKDREHPVEVTEYMKECRRNTTTWKQWPARMLRHKAMIQAARYAFSFSGIEEPDEFERSEKAVNTETKPNGKGLDDLAASVIKEDPVVLDNETGEIIKPKKKGVKNVKRKNDKQTRDAAEAH